MKNLLYFPKNTFKWKNYEKNMVISEIRHFWNILDNASDSKVIYSKVI